ncbi:CrcB family protein [Rhodobacter sp. 24-YEA-8]|uniref:fluoride efflux transporter FluC n=1 Tax=Rhodobacter sp. 24-YEA-8 TaxID=1884310 RepID=UPI0008954EFC|nr:CrcB family protein [Rhodobacter sp. 24-YEA-8]SEB47397.1 camphor resistance protein CrcB [Rhodobacter sp. 24-YEA-8]
MMHYSGLFALALGGAAGTVLRHLIISLFGAPWAVAAINITGSFLIGLAWVMLSQRLLLGPVVMTGLLGGFTTFSAFSLDTLKLIEIGRLAEALAYVAVSVFFSLFAVFLGVTLARQLS